MKEKLVRFGVAFEESLLEQLDELAEARGCTRSELLRDVARAEVGRANVERGVEAVGALTLVYDHHRRGLIERLTEIQHQLGDGVRANLHVHLDHHTCLEIIVLSGKSDQLSAIADQTLAMRGVQQGGIEIIPRKASGHSHDHD